MLNLEARAQTPAPLALVPDADDLQQAMEQVLSVESDFVAKFLPCEAMTRVPPGFAAFAHWHFGQRRDPGLRWQDVAPAYALACLSHAAYGGALDPAVEWELELQWADLAPLSRLPWPQARPLVMAAWAFLTGDDALPADLDALLDDDAAASSPQLEQELVPVFVVLRESMAQQPISAWRTRGQERWLPTDVPALSLAASPALALLDALTLHGFVEEEPRYLVRLAVPPHLVHALDANGGDHSPLELARRRRETARWVAQQDSVLLQVPSPLCPGEFNLLVNPRHPDFARLQRFDARPLQLDRRQRSH